MSAARPPRRQGVGISGSESAPAPAAARPAGARLGRPLRLLHEGEPGAWEFAGRLEADGVPVERIRLPLRRRPAARSRGSSRAIAPRSGRRSCTRTSCTPTSYGLPAGTLARVPVLASTKHGFNAFRDERAFAAADRARRPARRPRTSRSRRGLARYLAETEGFDADELRDRPLRDRRGPGAAAAARAGPRLALRRPARPDQGPRRAARARSPTRARACPSLELELAGRRAARAGAARAGRASSGSTTRSTFLGRVAPVAPVLERAGIVVVPSLGEGFGHGRARGDGARPAGDRERRRRPAGDRRRRSRPASLVPPGDVDALAAAIVELARDPPRAAAMGAAGRAARARGVLAGALHRADRRRSTMRRSARRATGVAAASPRRARARTPRAARARSPTARGSGSSRRTPSPSSVL